MALLMLGVPCVLAKTGRFVVLVATAFLMIDLRVTASVDETDNSSSLGLVDKFVD
jgi:hypothetical protein